MTNCTGSHAEKLKSIEVDQYLLGNHHFKLSGKRLALSVTDWSWHVEITCLVEIARGIELKTSKYSRGIHTRYSVTSDLLV